jgi:hypothetical protein
MGQASVMVKYGKEEESLTEMSRIWAVSLL